MRLYADSPVRRTRQIVADLLVIAWVVLWVQVGRWVHEAISRLAAPGRTLEDAGSSLEDGLTSAGEGIAQVPLLGDDLRAPFDAAGEAAGAITEAGIGMQAAVAQAALLTAIAVAAWPIVVVLLAWLRARIRFARRAGVVQRMLDGGAGIELFALRALAHQPLRSLAAVSDDPVGDWRRSDPVVLRGLAQLELAAAGVALPAAAVAVAPPPGDLTPGGRSRFAPPE